MQLLQLALFEVFPTRCAPITLFYKYYIIIFYFFNKVPPRKSPTNYPKSASCKSCKIDKTANICKQLLTNVYVLIEIDFRHNHAMAEEIRKYQNAVDVIKTAILQSQARAAKAVNQEQLALYSGIGRYVSANSRKKNWGKGAIDTISEQLRKELPGLRGFSATSMRNMRTFYEEWRQLENNSSVATDEIQVLPSKSSVATDEITKINTSANSVVGTTDFADDAEIRQLQLANLPNFPLREFLSISFTHHIAILTKAKTYEERVFYMKYADGYKPTVEDLEKVIKQDLYHHQDKMPNNFLATIPDYKKAYRAICMFKDEYLLNFINVEELGMHDEDIDEEVIESNIVHNVKNFIMTFGKGFSFSGSQVHYDKLGHSESEAIARFFTPGDTCRRNIYIIFTDSTLSI